MSCDIVFEIGPKLYVGELEKSPMSRGMNRLPRDAPSIIAPNAVVTKPQPINAPENAHPKSAPANAVTMFSPPDYGYNHH